MIARPENIYEPDEETIEEMCHAIQQTWNDRERQKRILGADLCRFGNEYTCACGRPVVANSLKCDDCYRTEQAIEEGRFIGTPRQYNNGQPEFHDRQYNGDGGELADNEWWGQDNT